ncbi:MAG: carbamoylphosphate synthase large subunit [Acidaminococcaceae bacterium]|nr:carbamoylphosphate synthase large subunit [Acidaminococcaceae bacterium]
MNFIFISPQFPRTYWNFCDRLKKNGANVLGIGDTPYDQLDPALKSCLTEYYKVESMEDYDQMFRAVAFFSFKYGKINWLESNNEYWLEHDAMLRTDFNILSGPDVDEIEAYRSKSAMKPYYAKAKVPTARQAPVTDIEAAAKFIKKAGYPVIVKPEYGVGAVATYRLENDEDLEAFFADLPEDSYVMEEYVPGLICSYDAIVDSQSNVLFESMSISPPVMDVVNNQTELCFYVPPSVEPQLQERGRATVKSFGVKSRFVHMEFFKLTKDKKGLGKVGDFVGLEVNMRPGGGYMPDMMDFAHSTDVYQLWADMITFDERRLPEHPDQQFCVFIGQRDRFRYAHSQEDIMARYGSRIKMCERMPDILSGAMGNQMYTAILPDKEAMDEFVSYVTEKAAEPGAVPPAANSDIDYAGAYEQEECHQAD